MNTKYFIFENNYDLKMKIEVFDEFNQELKKIWSNLSADKSCCFFQNYNWIYNWYNNIGFYQNLQIQIIVGYSSKETYFIIPLCIQKIKFARILRFLGGDQTDYNEIVFSNRFVINLISFNLKKFKEIFTIIQ